MLGTHQQKKFIKRFQYLESKAGEGKTINGHDLSRDGCFLGRSKKVITYHYY
jgi:hypothetical protein